MVGHAASVSMNRSSDAERVEILLGLCNGERYLHAQLASFRAQAHTSWSLLVSDDRSTDNGPDAVRQFFRSIRHQDARLVKGPCKGFAQNFLSLLRSSDPSAKFFAFADQDDVWLPEKLSRATDALEKEATDTPAMYCGRTYHCDASLKVLRASPNFRRAPSFRNALWQNIGGGNTIVLNRAARHLLARESQNAANIVSHDWWMYQMISGVGGRVIYERRPAVLYRQHGENAVGAREGSRAGAERLAHLAKGRFGGWSRGHVDALWKSRDCLTAENRDIVARVRALENAPLATRGAELFRLGLYRQRPLETALMWAAATTGRA